MSDFDHLLGHEDQQEIPLDQLKKLVDRFRKADKEVNELEEKLKVAKEIFNQVSQTDIPQFLLQYGVSGVPLSTGEMLRIKQEISASVKDIDSFSDFLTERGDDDILKTNIKVGKVPTEIAQKIAQMLVETYGLSADIERSVHSMTLKKYVKELCGIGMENAEERLGDRYVPLQELPESVSVFTYFKTTINKK